MLADPPGQFSLKMNLGPTSKTWELKRKLSFIDHNADRPDYRFSILMMPERPNI